MPKMENSNEEDEVQFIEERVRPSTRSSNDAGQSTQPPPIPAPELVQEQQIKQESDDAPSLETHSTLTDCLNLTKGVVELQTSNINLTIQLRKERASSDQLKTQLANVTTKLKEMEKEKVLLQFEHERDITKSKHETNEERQESTTWMNKYAEMKEKNCILEGNLKEQENEHENLKNELKRERDMKELSVQNLNWRLQEKGDELKNLQGNYIFMCDEYDRAIAELADARKNNSTLEEWHNQTILENEGKQKDAIYELERKIEELRSTIIDQSSTISANSIQITDLSTNLQKTERDIKSKDCELEKIEAKLNVANGKIDQLNKDNQDLKKKLDEIVREEKEKRRFQSNFLLDKLRREKQEKERLSKDGKRGNMGDVWGYGEGSKKKRNDTTPVSSHSSDDKQTSTSEGNQVNIMDSIDVAPSQHNDDDDLTTQSASTVNGNASSSEATGIDEDGASNVFYDKFHKIRRNNL